MSYRGEKGKTTGYYVPKAAQEATREGVAAWQKMQECLRELAELNKERNLQTCPRGRFTMKPRFWLTMVCWALVCLLLSLSQQAGLYHPLQVSGSSQWLDRCREPASGSPTASVFKSTQFDPARAGPLTSLVLEDAWTDGKYWPTRARKSMGHRSRSEFAGCRRKDGSSKQEQPTLPQGILTPADGI